MAKSLEDEAKESLKKEGVCPKCKSKDVTLERTVKLESRQGADSDGVIESLEGAYKCNKCNNHFYQGDYPIGGYVSERKENNPIPAVQGEDPWNPVWP